MSNSKPRQLVRATLIYGLGGFLNRMLGFLLLPLFTRYLTPEDYGINVIVSVVILILVGIFTLGTGNSMGICYFETQDIASRTQVVWTTIAVLALNSAILCTLGVFFSVPISRLLFQSTSHSDIITLAIISLGLQTVTDPLWAYLRLEDKARTFVILSIFSLTLTLGLNVYLLAYLGHGLRGLFETNLLVKIIMLTTLLMLGKRSLPLQLNIKIVPPLLRIGFPSIFALGAFYIIDYVDRIMLQHLTNVHEVGVYAVGYSFGMVMALGVDAFGYAWSPFFISFITKRNEVKLLFGQVLKYYLAGFSILCLVFFALAKPLVALITAPPFHSAFSVVGLVALAYMFKGCYLIMLPGIYFEKKLYLQVIIEWCAAILTVFLNLLLIPHLGKEGAALTTCFAYLSLPVLTHLVGSRYLTVCYEWKKIGIMMGGFLIAILAITLSNTMNSLLIQSSFSLLSLCLFSLFVVFTGFDSTERYKVRQLIGGCFRL